MPTSRPLPIVALILVAGATLSVVIVSRRGMPAPSVVRSAAAPVRADACASLADENADSRMLESVADAKGAAAAYGALKAGWSAKPLSGHILAHLVGCLAYRKDGIGGLAICDTGFAFGCYHGFIGALIGDVGERGIAEARAGCHALATADEAASCLHGIGHGVMEWKEDIAQAIGECETVPAEDRRYCFDGAYMDYYMGTMSGYAKPKADPADPWSFCMAMPEDSREMCVRNHAIYLLASHALAFPVVFAACAAIDPAYKIACVSSIGHFAADRRGHDAGTVTAFCGGFVDADDRAYCVESAAEEIAFQRKDATFANALCDGLRPPWEARCLDGVAARLK